MKKILSLLLCFMVCLSVFAFPVKAEGEYRTWLQSDSRWGSITFGEVGDTISKSGCAVTSIAKLMVHSGAVPDDPSVFNPGIFCNWLKENGGFTSRGGIYWAKAGEYTSKFSYVGECMLSGSEAQKAATIASYINEGCVVVAMVKNGGHYVAVDKVDGSTVTIMDPANTGYTNLFDYDAAGVEKLRIYKGPHNGKDNPSFSYDTTIAPIGASVYTITSDDGVNLRAGAGTSFDKLTAIPYNTKVTVTKVQDGWGYTTYDGKSGWFTLEFAKTSVTVRGIELVPPAKTQYLTGEALDTQGMKVTVLYSDGTSKVITSGYSVSSFPSSVAGKHNIYVSYGAKAAVFTVTVTKPVVKYTTGSYAINSTDGLNLRSDHNTAAQILVTIPHATHVEVTEIFENWGKITYGEYSGWICLDYTKLLKETAIQTAIQVTVSQPCFILGHVFSTKDFTVHQVFSDGTLIPTNNFAFSLKPLADNQMEITLSQGEFSASVTVKLFESIPLGDSNFDGAVNATDALAILKKAVGKSVEPFYNEVCDLNGDQKYDTKDALLVLRFAVGKIEKFPIEEQTPAE